MQVDDETAAPAEVSKWNRNGLNVAAIGGVPDNAATETITLLLALRSDRRSAVG